ncbi:MAG TPA: c-type cytochrome, partial [Pirellulaceae bacterium]|nr:c-type cytochrome [Pirellulaceae bacterium]
TAVDERAKLAFPQRAALVAGLAEAARGKVSDPTGGFVLTLLLDDKSQAIKPALDKLCATASEVAATTDQPLDVRSMAVQLLGYTQFDQSHAALLKLVDPSQPSELQSQAIRSLGLLRDARVARELLAPRRFAAYTPTLREDVLAAVIADPQHAAGLLDALEAGDLPVGAIDALRRRILTQHKDAALRARAEKLFGAVAGDRAQVYAELKAVVEWKADAARGRDVFKRNCAACHRLDRDGFAVGPDLFGIRNQPKPAILLHILVPDQEITQGFTAYTVLTSDGRSLTGLIVAESPTTLTLRLPQGKEEQLLRTDIEELIASKLSLMPQGLEKNISKQEFADLLAYLKGEQAAAP